LACVRSCVVGWTRSGAFRWARSGAGLLRKGLPARLFRRGSSLGGSSGAGSEGSVRCRPAIGQVGCSPVRLCRLAVIAVTPPALSLRRRSGSSRHRAESMDLPAHSSAGQAKRFGSAPGTRQGVSPARLTKRDPAALRRAARDGRTFARTPACRTATVRRNGPGWSWCGTGSGRLRYASHDRCAGHSCGPRRCAGRASGGPGRRAGRRRRTPRAHSRC